MPRGERKNFVYAVALVAMYEENLNKYGPRGANAEKYGQNKEEQDE